MSTMTPIVTTKMTTPIVDCCHHYYDDVDIAGAMTIATASMKILFTTTPMMLPYYSKFDYCYSVTMTTTNL